MMRCIWFYCYLQNQNITMLLNLWKIYFSNSGVFRRIFPCVWWLEEEKQGGNHWNMNLKIDFFPVNNLYWTQQKVFQVGMHRAVLHTSKTCMYQFRTWHSCQNTCSSFTTWHFPVHKITEGEQDNINPFPFSETSCSHNYYFPITIVKFPMNWNMNIASLSHDKGDAIIFKPRVLNSGEILMHSRDHSMTSL